MDSLADEEIAWQKNAQCRGTEHSLFFPEDFDSHYDRWNAIKIAKGICTRCEVRAECLDFALRHNEKYGIWGGLLPRERERLKPRGKGA